MVITGKTGLGKTYLLECVAKAAKEKGIDVMLIRAGELFRLFFDHRMGEDVDLGFLYRADLLLADDIGTEPITNNVSVEYFYELVSKRLDAKKHTVYSTNIDDLQQRYDDRIASRLNSKEDSLMLLFDGGDLRSRK
jgi:DNA replication protein DnaC